MQILSFKKYLYKSQKAINLKLNSIFLILSLNHTLGSSLLSSVTLH